MEIKYSVEYDYDKLQERLQLIECEASDMSYVKIYKGGELVFFVEELVAPPYDLAICECLYLNCDDIDSCTFYVIGGFVGVFKDKGILYAKLDTVDAGLVKVCLPVFLDENGDSTVEMAQDVNRDRFPSTNVDKQILFYGDKE
jgi:hypothetical protein